MSGSAPVAIHDSVSLSDEQAVGAEQEPSARAIEAELLERREAALAQVVKFGDPVLKSRASQVTEFGPELRAEVERMIAIMRDGMGVGLAATQVGILRRLLVFQAGPRRRADGAGQPDDRVGSPTRSSSPRRAASACRGSRWTSSGRCTRGSAASTSTGEP